MNRFLEFKWPLLAIVCGITFFLIGLCLGWYVCPELFSRFGSLVALSGAITEYQTGRLPFLRPIRQLGYGSSEPEEPKKKKRYLINDNSIGLSGHVLAIGGTLIWGFGDIALELLKKT